MARPLPALALVAVLLTALALPATADSARRMEIALQDEPVFVHQGYFDREQALLRARELQVTRIRANVLWSKVVGDQARQSTPPARPVYDWKPFDDLIDAAARHGIRVHLSLTTPAPAYATSNRRIGVVRPNPSLYAAFVREAARHFRGRVDRYSILNEPNLTSWLSPKRSAPALYRRLYEAGYRAIKSADRRAKVLIGETVPDDRPRRLKTAPLDFLRKVLCVAEVRQRRGERSRPDRSSVQRRRDKGYVKPRYRRARRCRGLKADGYAHHPYDFKRPIAGPERIVKGKDNATLGTLHHLVDALDEFHRLRVLRTSRGRKLDLYLTEYGYFAIGRRNPGLARRASFLRRGFQLAQQDRRVRSMLQYLLVQPPPGYPGAFFDLSILNRLGAPTRPYRSLAAWARAAARRGLVKRPGGPIPLPPAPPV